MQALLFDLGGTHLRSAVLCANGALETVQAERVASHFTGASTDETWNGIRHRVAKYAREVGSSLPTSAPVVMAFPGPVTGGRNITRAPTLTGDSPVPDLAAEIGGATGRPVYLVNDVAAAAWRFADITTVARFMVVTVSSGIGAKLFDRDNKRLVLETPGYAGEIGHFRVDDAPDAPECDCGQRGHLGAIASGRGIERAARRWATADPSAFALSEAGGAGVSGAVLTNEDHLVPACLRGDDWSLALVRKCTMPLSRTLVSTLMAAGLDHIFLIGGFAEALGDVYLEIVRTQVAHVGRHPFDESNMGDRVTIAATDDNACLTGCAVFARHLNSREHP